MSHICPRMIRETNKASKVVIRNKIALQVSNRRILQVLLCLITNLGSQRQFIDLLDKFWKQKERDVLERVIVGLNEQE